MLASHHYEHPEPIMMPYNMEYALPSHAYHAAGGGTAGSDMSANELYSLHMAAAGGGQAGGAAGGNDGNNGGSGGVISNGGEGMTAESSLTHVVNLNNATQLGGFVGLQAVPKVKRQDKDMWAGNWYNGPNK